MIRKHNRRWGGLYGDTHRGSVWTLVGVPVWRWRKPLRPAKPSLAKRLLDWIAPISCAKCDDDNVICHEHWCDPL